MWLVSILVASYSRPDRRLVTGVISIIRGAFPELHDAVFWDGEFRAGEDWFDQFKRGVDAAPRVFVFWCYHSVDSQQVAREYQYAESQKKPVVPVLLDQTPLNADLARIEGIDLREMVRHPRKRRETPGSRVEVPVDLPTRIDRIEPDAFPAEFPADFDIDFPAPPPFPEEPDDDESAQRQILKPEKIVRAFAPFLRRRSR